MKIDHKITKNRRAYGDEIAELWIDLPNGEKLYFSEVEFYWSDDEDEMNKCINEAKERILEQLNLLCK
jgi:hypothetical protein